MYVLWRDLSLSYQCVMSGVGSPVSSVTTHRWSTLEAGVLEKVSSEMSPQGITNLHWVFPLHLTAPQFQRPIGAGLLNITLFVFTAIVNVADGRMAAPNSTWHPNSSSLGNLSNCWYQNVKCLHIFLKVRLTWIAILYPELGRGGDGLCIWRNAQFSHSF